jgi:hypothetical protein
VNDAFKANRLICPAMPEIEATIPPISSDSWTAIRAARWETRAARSPA